MTLTTIMPSLRRSIPDPLDVNAWPEATVATIDDVAVAGVSLCRLVELCETPCVHTAAAVIPGTHGRPSPVHQAAVVVVSVTSVMRRPDGSLDVLVDACLDDLAATWRETRLIGRPSTAAVRTAQVAADPVHHRGPCATDAMVSLPADLAEGDLLAIPCAGTLSVRSLR